MSTFNISNITPAGALCTAMAAARENDRRNGQSRRSTSVATAKLAPATIWPATIWNVLGDMLRLFGRTYRTETA